jgi:hypothetical protein
LPKVTRHCELLKQLSSHARNVARNNIQEAIWGLKTDLDSFGNSLVDRVDKSYELTDQAIDQWRDDATTRAD